MGPGAPTKAGLAPGGKCALACHVLMDEQGWVLVCSDPTAVLPKLCGFKGFAQKLSVPSFFFSFCFFLKLCHK